MAGTIVNAGIRNARKLAAVIKARHESLEMLSPTFAEEYRRVCNISMPLADMVNWGQVAAVSREGLEGLEWTAEQLQLAIDVLQARPELRDKGTWTLTHDTYLGGHVGDVVPSWVATWDAIRQA